MLLPLLLCSLSLAQEGDQAFEAVPLQEPLPLHGEPWPLEVHSYVLPPQDVSWLESTDAFRSCVLTGHLEPGAQPRFELGACPEAMGPVALEATRRWHLEPAPEADPEGPTRFEIRYVVRYSETLAMMTTHATIDPGERAAFDGYAGVPGVKLVHPARLTRIGQPRMPRAARKAGIEPATCQLRVDVQPSGDPGPIAVIECPDGLSDAAIGAARKARYTPRVIDGMTEHETISVPVPFR
jgi:hypothetical protein